MPNVKSFAWSSAAARIAAAGGALLLSLAFAAIPRAEPGERFERAAPAPLVLPVAGTDDEPVGPAALPRDPPRLEAARGGAVRDGLAQSRRAPEPERAAVKPSVPKRALAAETATPPRASFLIPPAYAGEPDRASRPSAWRRWLGSPYAAWIAAILLIGMPLLGALRRHLAGWREARDLAEYD
jgi:hypothetical protein